MDTWAHFSSAEIKQQRTMTVLRNICSYLRTRHIAGAFSTRHSQSCVVFSSSFVGTFTFTPLVRRHLHSLAAFANGTVTGILYHKEAKNKANFSFREVRCTMHLEMNSLHFSGVKILTECSSGLQSLYVSCSSSLLTTDQTQRSTLLRTFKTQR